MTVSQSSVVGSVTAEVVEEFLSSYWSRRTRGNYAFILHGWFTWCANHEIDPISDIGPRMIEAWIADLQKRGYAANTIAGCISAVSAFYRWCVREQRIDRNPIDAVRRPRRPNESTTVSLTRHELTDWLAAAEARGGSWWAAAMLLGLNGLRCSELVACDVADVGSHSWHHTLALRTTKGDRPTVVALAPPTMQAIAAAIGGRRDGPLLLNRAGRRMTTYNVQYLVAALAHDARIDKNVTPHGLRHSAITIGLQLGAGGVPLRTGRRRTERVVSGT
jgi:site-specific recombinase XerD